MTNNRFDLIDILQEIFRKIKFVLIFTLCAVVIGLIFSFIQPNQYMARSVFIVKSPSNMDRNHIFRQGEYQDQEFFATENQIDQIVTMGKSDALLSFLIDSLDLVKAYQVKNKDAATKRLSKRFDFKRNDTKSIEIKVTDEDPQRAAQLAQAATRKIETMYRDFFLQNNRDMVNSLQKKITGIDQHLMSLEDSINRIRNQYGIFDQLLPSRGTTIINNGNGSAQKDAGMELLQKVATLKDQLVKDRATYYSLINEYNVGLQNENLDLFYIVEKASPPGSPSFPKVPLIVAICLLAGLAFSCILVLITAYLRNHIAKRK